MCVYLYISFLFILTLKGGQSSSITWVVSGEGARHIAREGRVVAREGARDIAREGRVVAGEGARDTAREGRVVAGE